MLEFRDVVIRQGTFSAKANFSVPYGGITAVIGPSGAGKSTLLNAVAGFLPYEGRIFWNTADMNGLSPGKRPVAMLFQDHNLFPHLNVATNVALGINPSLRLSEDDKTRVSDALTRVGLHGLDSRKPAQLSGGQQSRAALARVLVQKRPLILLDEPFAALGPALREEMLDLVAALAHEQGASVMMISHNPSDAERVSERTILVADGVARAPMETQDLLNNPPEVLRDYLGAG